MNEPLISIIMATYNSEGTIDKSLKSIRCQQIEQESVEILVIDGGSTDKTIEIAKKYKCKIISNPARLPEMAKRIGMQNAMGKYLQIMDSDEVLPGVDVLTRRLAFMDAHEDVMLLLAGYTAPLDAKSFCGEYINIWGDPFSAFAYNWFVDGNIGIVKQASECCLHGAYIGVFEENDITPIGDSLTLFRGDFVRKKYADILGAVNTTVLFQKVLRETHMVGVLEGDYVHHYSRAGLGTYLRKLKFRVINNVFDKSGAGYSSSTEGNRKLTKRKYLFPFYCLSIVFPIYHGVKGSISYRNIVFLLHPFFCWYVLIEIIYQYLKKSVGKKSVNKFYG